MARKDRQKKFRPAFFERQSCDPAALQMAQVQAADTVVEIGLAGEF